MKKLQLFKIFESRSSELTEVEFYKLLRENCKDFIAKPKLLQRIKGGKIADYSYLDPSKHIRNPLMKEDDGGVFSSHHSLLMDNL